MTASRKLRRWWPLWSLLGLGLGGVACGGAERPPHLPPPVYEQPQLPPWEPEESPQDPLEDAFEQGEWVEEPPDGGESTNPKEPQEGPKEPQEGPEPSEPPSEGDEGAADDQDDAS